MFDRLIQEAVAQVPGPLFEGGDHDRLMYAVPQSPASRT